MGDLVEVPYDSILTETDEALLVLIDDREIWFPKSQCQELDDWRESVLLVESWLAEKEGLV